ncbi:ETS-related transcription factor Elf-5-like, partial [Argonauta hians]
SNLHVLFQLISTTNILFTDIKSNMDGRFWYDFDQYEIEVGGKESNILCNKSQNESASFQENLSELQQRTNNPELYPYFEDISDVSSPISLSSSLEALDSSDQIGSSELNWKDLLEISFKDFDADFQINEKDFQININDNKRTNSSQFLGCKEGRYLLDLHIDDFLPDIGLEQDSSVETKSLMSPLCSNVSKLEDLSRETPTSPHHYSDCNFPNNRDKCRCDWSLKPITYWNGKDVENWVGYVTDAFDTTLESKHFEDINSGQQLKYMPCKEFQRRDFIYGKWAYIIFRGMLDPLSTELPDPPHILLTQNSKCKSDACSKNPQKESLYKMKGLPLYKFIYSTLKNPLLNPTIIRWQNKKAGEFQLVDPERFAELWGQTKQNKKMNFAKLGRSLRYYYAKKILTRVSKGRLIYKFLEPFYSGFLQKSESNPDRNS